jgi:hypothetical protein
MRSIARVSIADGRRRRDARLDARGGGRVSLAVTWLRVIALFGVPKHVADISKKNENENKI